jgi:predicted transcriptional regulator
MKTIKQIADELGVSKQKVYRFIVRNHITASSEVKQSKLYDEATEMLIKQGILEDEPYQKSHHEAHQNRINEAVFDAVIEMLQKELEIKNEQIKELNERLSECSAALLAAQQTTQAAQVLHAGTIQKEIASGESGVDKQKSASEKKNRWFKRLFRG